MEIARNEMKTLKELDLKAVKVYRMPPQAVKETMNLVLNLFQLRNYRQDEWRTVMTLLGDTESNTLLDKFHKFRVENLPREVLDQVEAEIDGLGYPFIYDHFTDNIKCVGKFC